MGNSYNLDTGTHCPACWMRSEGVSLIPVILLHAMDNLLSMSYLDSMSTDKRIYYLAREQGVITITLEIYSQSIKDALQKG